ncbi:MAG: cobalt chelatase, partial [Burkholderiales bacterium]|nr:cobalt chelatase [Burkholderiales bacterium]
ALALAEMVAPGLEIGPATRPRAEGEALEQEGGFSLLVDFDAEVDDGIRAAPSVAGRAPAEGGDDYRVFTRAYDREGRPAARLRPALLAEYRDTLDRRIAEQGLNVARLARRLRALLALPQRDGWDDDQEEGRIDGRRLARLIATPSERRLFRIERELPAADCVVAWLIDCSGSMKQHIEAVALLADVFMRALEQAGAAGELLGFSTGAWNGGRAAADWRRAGRPALPGRLNEAEHFVFKDADTPWRRARRDIAALLRAELFREGIDGEAVDWACERLEARPEARRILIVVSDGCPMDGATALANDPGTLERHLREVLGRREQNGRVEVFGLGVGLDLSGFYSRSLALDLDAGAGNAALAEIVSMLARCGRRPG